MAKVRVFPFVLKLILFFALFLACAVGLLIAAERIGVREDLPVGASVRKTFVIDAGHGGRDGGAIGIGGSLEKDIDLAIAKKLSALLSFCGEKVVMTRTEDEILSLPGTTGNVKGRDIRSRIRIADQTPGALLVSIHANSFPTEKYRGLQVFYSPSDPASREAATAVRRACTEYLPEAGDREIKKASPTIYLLNNVKSPAILIECGFISNAEEEKLLCNGSYQIRLCAIICAGLLSQSDKANTQGA